MVSYDDLRNGRHTYCVATQQTIHLVFCGSLEGWSLYTHIDTIGDANLLLLGNVRSLLDQAEIIRLVHIRETRTCGEILTTQRVLWEEVDMVGDNHQVANLEGRVHAASSIRYEERLDAQFVHHTDGECNLLHRVALVEVETSLHSQDVYTSQFAEDELP